MKNANPKILVVSGIPGLGLALGTLGVFAQQIARRGHIGAGSDAISDDLHGNIGFNGGSAIGNALGRDFDAHVC